jgi:hypothetical protein
MMPFQAPPGEAPRVAPKGSVVRRFGVAPDPIFERFFFLAFVRMVHFCMEPSQLHDFF